MRVTTQRLNVSAAALLGLILTCPTFGHPPDEHDNAEPASTVAIEVRGDFRFIKSNGLPDHATGQFPNRDNPGRIREQHFEFRVPVKPTVADKPTELGPTDRPPGGGRPGGRPSGGPDQRERPGTKPPGRGNPPWLFGVAINGVVFDPGTAEWWNDDPKSGWHVDALGPTTKLGVDQHHAHVQPPTGTYHYHGVPTGLLDKLSDHRAGSAMVLIGWAADGFPIYARWGEVDGKVRELKSSYRLKTGERAGGPGGRFDGTYVEDFEFVQGLGDLDQFNGRTGATPEFPAGTYYYVVTEQFPSVPRQLRGVPDESFRKGPPRRGAEGGPQRDEVKPAR